MGMYADLFKEESGVFRRSYNGNQVIVLKGERTGRNINISARRRSDSTAVGRFPFTGEIRPIAISKQIESEDFKHE